MICEKCGTTLEVGSFPFCKGDPADHGIQASSVIGDEIDIWIKHGICNEDGTPKHYTSRETIRKESERLGMENRVRHCPLPGTDKSKHTVRWVSAPTISEADRVRRWHEHEAALG